MIPIPRLLPGARYRESVRRGLPLKVSVDERGERWGEGGLGEGLGEGRGGTEGGVQRRGPVSFQVGVGSGALLALGLVALMKLARLGKARRERFD